MLNATMVDPGTLESAVLAQFREAGGPFTPSEMAEVIDHDYSATKHAMYRLAEKGLLARSGRGVYVLPVSSEASDRQRVDVPPGRERWVRVSAGEYDAVSDTIELVGDEMFSTAQGFSDVVTTHEDTIILRGGSVEYAVVIAYLGREGLPLDQWARSFRTTQEIRGRLACSVPAEVGRELREVRATFENAVLYIDTPFPPNEITVFGRSIRWDTN